MNPFRCNAGSLPTEAPGGLFQARCFAVQVLGEKASVEMPSRCSIPRSCWMCSWGLAMVALATMNCGARRYSRRQMRRSRRSTNAAWQPNTPL